MVFKDYYLLEVLNDGYIDIQKDYHIEVVNHENVVAVVARMVEHCIHYLIDQEVKVPS